MTGKSARDGGRSKLTQLAYDRIKQAIVGNKLKPGLVISGSQLAKYFQMSRTPIREAIQLLANEYLVEMKNGVGFSVKALTLEELREINEVRIALECAALSKAMEGISQERLLEHIRQWEELGAKLQAGDESVMDQIVELDNETHRLITLSSGNGYLIRLMDDIGSRTTQSQYLAVAAGCAPSTVEQHIAVIEAMLADDLPLAQSRLAYHMQYAVEKIEEYVQGQSPGLGAQLSDSYFHSVFDF